MRMSMFVGLILITMGGTTLYQIRNGFFMYVVGQFTYWPPSDPAAVGAAFGDLAAETSETPGVSLGDVAEARLSCISEFAGDAPKSQVGDALHRLNLVLLGVGVNSTSPVIEPNARRLTELRADLTRDARDWRERELREREEARLSDVMEGLMDPEHRMYDGLDLAASFGHLDLRNYVNVLLAGGEALHDCVKSRRS